MGGLVESGLLLSEGSRGGPERQICHCRKIWISGGAEKHFKPGFPKWQNGLLPPKEKMHVQMWAHGVKRAESWCLLGRFNRPGRCCPRADMTVSLRERAAWEVLSQNTAQIWVPVNNYGAFKTVFPVYMEVMIFSFLNSDSNWKYHRTW